MRYRFFFTSWGGCAVARLRGGAGGVAVRRAAVAFQIQNTTTN
jgi:hypothetical protein